MKTSNRNLYETNNKKVWNYITQFAEFNRFTNSPVANYKGELYSLPFNMYTFNKMWGVVTPEEANDLPKTIISREYSSEWKSGDEPYYPVNDAKNGLLYSEYKKLGINNPRILAGIEQILQNR